MFKFNQRFTQVGKSRSIHLKSSEIDYSILGIIISLVMFGLIMVYDASVVQAYKDFSDKYFYIKQQLIWATLGFFSLFFFLKFNYHNFKKLAVPSFLFSLLMLFAVFLPGLGISAGGAHRWLNLFGFTLQPAEIIKLSSIIFLSFYFERRVKSFHFFSLVLLITALIGIFQKDLGTAIVFFLISIGIYFVAGAPTIYFLSLIPISILSFIVFVLSSPYREQRILAFLNPFIDPQGYSYHISQVLIALGSGGLLGLGLGQSKQKFEYIPEVTTDSIFAIIGEELGFIGCVVFIIFFSFFIYKGFKISQNCHDRFGKLIAFGITFWLGVQATVNLGAMVAIIPLTGVPLPFISYGGSALFINLTAVGILLNISKNSS